MRIVGRTHTQTLVRDNYNLKSHKYLCITTCPPDTKSNPNPNRPTNPNRRPTTKQHAVVNTELNIVTCPTYPDKFIRDMLLHRLCPQARTGCQHGNVNISSSWMWYRPIEMTTNRRRDHSFIHSFAQRVTCLKTLKHTAKWAGQQGSALIVARDKKHFVSIISVAFPAKTTYLNTKSNPGPNTDYNIIRWY